VILAKGSERTITSDLEGSAIDDYYQSHPASILLAGTPHDANPIEESHNDTTRRASKHSVTTRASNTATVPKIISKSILFHFPDYFQVLSKFPISQAKQISKFQ
jgi:hypothetical protein